MNDKEKFKKEKESPKFKKYANKSNKEVDNSENKRELKDKYETENDESKKENKKKRDKKQNQKKLQKINILEKSMNEDTFVTDKYILKNQDDTLNGLDKINYYKCKKKSNVKLSNNKKRKNDLKKEEYFEDKGNENLRVCQNLTKEDFIFLNKPKINNIEDKIKINETNQEEKNIRRDINLEKNIFWNISKIYKMNQINEIPTGKEKLIQIKKDENKINLKEDIKENLINMKLKGKNKETTKKQERKDNMVKTKVIENQIKNTYKNYNNKDKLNRNKQNNKRGKRYLYNDNEESRKQNKINSINYFEKSKNFKYTKGIIKSYFIIIFLINLLSININCIYINSIILFYSYITMKVLPGERLIFGNQKQCFTNPNQVFINNDLKTPVNNQYNFIDPINTVKLVWTTTIQSTVCMFENCDGIKEIDFTHFETSEVTNFGIMFLNCKSLISLDLSKFDTSKSINIGTMFQNCISLTSIDVSSFDTSSIKYMDN